MSTEAENAGPRREPAGPGWFPDPYGRHEWRWFDGGWTDRVNSFGSDAIDTPGASGRPSQGAVEDPGGDDEESLLRAGGVLLGYGLLSLLSWLAPVIVLGGVGLVLVSLGTSESTDAFGRTVTNFNDRTMWLAFVFFALAAAVFFGRGSLRSLSAALRGQVGDVVVVGGTLLNLLLALGAIAVAAFAAFMAAFGAT